MAALRMTLQNRINTLSIISSVIFISAFTVIQLNNQVNNINRFNAYQSNLSSNIIKNNLEEIVRKTPLDGVKSFLQAGMKELADSGILKDALIYDKDRTIIAATEKQMGGKTVSYRELKKFEELALMRKENKSFLPEINKLKRSLDIFMALSSDLDGPVTYVAKVSFPLGNIKEALMEVYRPVVVAIIIVVLANILFGFILSKTVIGPIKALNEVTKIIAGGDLSIRTNIGTEDELQELGDTFNMMTEELIKMKDRAENANPLTKLPGNLMIQENVEERIKNGLKFVVIYCDLDNFKAFNDKYGIHKGDDAIKLTSDIFKEAAKLKGNADDFVGHEGGDDFILVTTPDKAYDIANYITSELDKRSRALYNQEDLAQGYIISHARDGSIKQFPLMSISLAGIHNEVRAIASYAEVTNIAAEIKKKAKAIEGSAFVMDKREDASGSAPAH
ncbi:MAG: diguanylate cyclase [Candidatus Omnitrophica bacterium]|nr:diguanylate cyclase [Candidatus Omnitrophota bacterium]